MAGWRSFVSWGTLVSGLLTVALWSLQWDLLSGVLVVLLLYAHEIGHVLAAAWRRVPVHRAPVFIPGFGAFVLVDPSPRPWDQVWVALGGPLLGSAAALAAKLAGIGLHSPSLAFAGQVMLWINLLNLLPFGPLDGGRVILASGWLGLVPAAFVGGFALSFNLGFVFSILIFMGLWQAWGAVRRDRSPRWSTRLGILGLYLLVVLVILVTEILSPAAPLLPSRPLLPGITLYSVGSFSFIAYLASGFLLGQAFRPTASAGQRYLTAALAGWPRYLVGEADLVPIMFSLAAHLAGLPGLNWLRRLLRRSATHADEAAGDAAAYGYDCLVRQGREAEAAAWLAEVTPLLQAAGPVVLREAYARIAGLGYATMADTWLIAAVDWENLPADAPADVVNSLAWVLLRRQQPDPALVLAERAVAAAPENAGYRDTLARVLLLLQRPAEAEAHLRLALEYNNHPRIRLTLARTLAVQERYGEAAREGERALRDLANHRAAREVDDDRVRRWVAEWREAAPPEPPAPPPTWRQRLTGVGQAAPAAAVLAAAALGFWLGT